MIITSVIELFVNFLRTITKEQKGMRVGGEGEGSGKVGGRGVRRQIREKRYESMAMHFISVIHFILVVHLFVHFSA